MNHDDLTFEIWKTLSLFFSCLIFFWLEKCFQAKKSTVKLPNKQTNRILLLVVVVVIDPKIEMKRKEKSFFFFVKVMNELAKNKTNYSTKLLNNNFVKWKRKTHSNVYKLTDNNKKYQWTLILPKIQWRRIFLLLLFDDYHQTNKHR